MAETHLEATSLGPQKPLQSGPLPAAQKLSQADRKVQAVLEGMSHTIEAKQYLVDEALGKTQKTCCGRVFSKLKRRYNVPLIAGDVFTVGYLGFQGIQSFSPTLAASKAAINVNFVCGIIGGVINIGVGFYCLYEGIKEWQREGHLNAKAIRLIFFDFPALLGLGAIMICTSLALKSAAFAGIGAFFAANPWLMMVFFLMLTGPLIVELKEDKQKYKELVSGLQLQTLKDLVEKSNTEGLRAFVENLFTNSESPLYLESLSEKIESINIRRELSVKMENLQEKVEVEAAIEIFKLSQILLDLCISDGFSDEVRRTQILGQQLEKTEKELAARNRALNTRIAQQVVYIIGSFITVGALCCQGNTANRLNGLVSFISMVANGIALYMDTFWPFNRNTPVVIKAVSFDGDSDIEIARDKLTENEAFAQKIQTLFSNLSASVA